MKKNYSVKLFVLGAVLLLMTGQAYAGHLYYAGELASPSIWAWSTVNSSNKNVYDAWPGASMTALPVKYNGHTVYSIEITGDDWVTCPEMVIFSSGGNQTADLPTAGYDKLYTGSGWVDYSYPAGAFWTVSGQLGDDSEWTDHFTTGDGTVQTCTLALAAGKEYYFKMKKVDGGVETWYSFGAAITRTTATNVTFSNGVSANAAVATTIAGDYVFTFNTSTMQLTITYPDALAESEINTTAVPSENGDVMIQAYYWAHEGNTATPYTPYGPIQWSDLNAQAAELGQYFDLVWLAPSAVTADYTGFLPTNYSNQNNVWGTKEELKTLIGSLHSAGAKVVADIVINHSSTVNDSYCSWDPFTFGIYGNFAPEKSWITNDDEIFISNTNSSYQRFDNGYAQNAGIKEDAGECGEGAGPYADENDYYTPGGAAQWSYAEYNCVYSRDWAHKKKEVREMCRAYLTWMKDSIGYDGWRYDFAKGIHGSHLDDYNKASNAAFAVSEVFDHDIAKEEGILHDANYNTYVFDFPGKYYFINDAFRHSVYNKLLGNASNTMLFNHKKYAVTFVENHDSFREHEHNLTQTPNEITDTNKVMMANAFILSMPGVPCVFYPHWQRFKHVLKPIIAARKLTGVHSESVVTDEAVSDYEHHIHYYKATIKGKNGNIRLLLGPNSGWATCPGGYRAAYVDSIIGMYYAVKGQYIKHNWGGGDWSWKELTDNGDGTFSVEGAYGGGGCNWSDLPSDELGLPYVDQPTIVGHPVVGQLATFTLNPSAGTVTITPAVEPVYFKKPHSGWPAVYAYAWKGEGAVRNADWPGKVMTLEGLFGGDSIYSYVADERYTSIIFNIGDNSQQTADLAFTANRCYVPGEGWKTLDQLVHSLSVPASGWASLYLPLSATMPDGVYAYYAESESAGTIVLQLLQDGAVPAKTGVLVKGDQGQYNIAAKAEEVESVASLLSGTALEASTTLLKGDKTLYALSISQSQPSAPAFGPYEGESVSANKAYLLLAGSSSAPDLIRFVINGENTATTLEELVGSDEVLKQLRGSQIVIIRSGVMYNVLGKRIQ